MGLSKKLSYYNYFVNDDNCVYAYNSLSNSFAILSNEEYNYLQEFSKSLCDIPKALEEELSKGMFLIPIDFSEIDFIKDRSKRFREKQNSLSITIVPTLDCNFRCTYCYEKGQRSPYRIQDDVKTKIYEYVEKKINEIKNLNITWYGGEPLLEKTTIEELSDRFISLCKEKNVIYNAGIVTNGYLIDESTLELFKRAQITHCQITIDGTKEYHDKRRILNDGSGSFDVIMKNLVKYGRNINGLTIRVNIDRDNLDAVDEIKNYFDKVGIKRIRVLPAPVRNTWNCFSEEKCLSMEEYFEFEKSSIEKGDFDVLTKSFPSLRANHCVADSQSGLVLDPEGNIYKCWCDLGIKQNSIGTIFEPIDTYIKNDLISFDPFSDEKCSKCKLLPVCLGGCFHDRLNANFGTCIPFKSNEETYIKYISQALVNNTEKAKEIGE